MTFNQQLLLTILDKFLIGGLIVLLGYYVNSALERFKSELRLKDEFRRQRNKHVGEVWSSLYAWDSAVISLVTSAAKAIKGGELQSRSQELKQLELRSKRLMEEAKEKAEANVFWIGIAEYNRVIKYQNALVEYMEAFASDDLNALKKAETKRDRVRRLYSDLQN